MNNLNQKQNNAPATRTGSRPATLEGSRMPALEGRQSPSQNGRQIVASATPTWMRPRNPTLSPNAGSSSSQPPTEGNGNSNPQARMQRGGAYHGSAERKRIKPQLQRYRDRRAANRIVERLQNIPESELSEEDKSKMAWAQSYIASISERKSNGEAPSETPSLASKRQRSVEEDILPDKRPRDGPSPQHPPRRPYSTVVKDNLVRAVIDRSQAEGTIPPEKWKLVEKALAKSYREFLSKNPGPPAACFDAGWYQGRVKLVACDDQRSADLYRLAISELGELWPGSRLEVVTKDLIPSRPRCRTWLPEEPSDPKEILEAIQISNPGLPTHDWRVAKVGEAKECKRQVILILNEESLKPLSTKMNTIHYIFTSAVLKIYAKDAKACLQTQVDTAEAEQGAQSDDGKSVSSTLEMFKSLSATDEDRLLLLSGEEDLETSERKEMLIDDEGGPNQSPPL